MKKINVDFDKYQLCTQIAKLCDELEDAKRQLRIINRNVENRGLGNPDLYCLEVGRRKVFEQSTYYTICRVDATRKDDGAISLTPFEDWRERVLCKVPDTMSKVEFFIYFNDLLKERYANECAEAIEGLEAYEAQEAE